MSALYGSKLTNIYIHLPFCRKKCFFCAFPVHATSNDASFFEPYLQTLLREIKCTPYSFQNLQSIYFGGGTPSLFQASHIKEILNSFPQKNANTEITMEVNPKEMHRIQDFLKVGVNRLSLGIQTFNSSINRDWNRQEASMQEITKKIKNLADVNISVDFILDFNQNQEEQQMLSFIKQAKPKHTTIYILQVNEGSYMHKHLQKFKNKYGKYDNYAKISKALQQLGYQHYEVSNFSLPGFESKHNRCYWAGTKEFAAYGMGATSFTNRCRVTRPRTLSKYYKYVDFLEKGENFMKLLEIETEKERNKRIESFLLSRLRIKEGIAWSQFEKQCSEEEIQSLKKAVVKIQAEKQGIIDVNFLANGVRVEIPIGYLYVDQIAFRMINQVFS